LASFFGKIVEFFCEATFRGVKFVIWMLKKTED